MKRYIIIIIAAFYTICAPAYSQTIKELEAKKKKTLNELSVTNKMLNETQKNKKGTENKLNLLNRSINQSSEYISTLNDQVSLISKDIDSIQTSKYSHEQRLEQLKSDYANSSRILYANHKYFSPILFILSSESFNQGYRRFRYLQEVANHRKKLALEISEITNTLVVQSNILIEDKIMKETLASQKSLEQQRLETQKRASSNELSSLKKKETQLKQKQKQQQAQADQLNNKIQDMIAAEIKRQEEAARKKAGTSSSSKSDPYVLSKDEKLIAGNFEANKGKLPRPIEKGFVSGKYGIQPHAVIQNVSVHNKGIYFQTPAGSDARAVFDGEVTQVFAVPGSNQSVIVKHGNYRTVYSNLKNVYVSVGDKVTTKQKIGKIYTDPEDDNKTELYFMLYKDTTLQDPSLWLAN
ncbi:MAG: peptidoglycan DD-metalloendopeptidase family protein [bacterium]